MPDITDAHVHQHEPIEAAESIVDGYLGRSGAPALVTGGDRACYSARADTLRMPAREAFETAEAYYSTVFHEMTHSTGHPTRLARKDLLEFHSFGDESYSREELVAEMGASYLSGLSGIEQVYARELCRLPLTLDCCPQGRWPHGRHRRCAGTTRRGLDHWRHPRKRRGTQELAA